MIPAPRESIGMLIFVGAGVLILGLYAFLIVLPGHVLISYFQHTSKK